MKLVLALFFFILSSSAHAQNLIDDNFGGEEESHFGVSVRGGLGVSDFTVQTATTKAIYSGFGVDANLALPIWQNSVIAFNADFGYRYFDLSNTANSSGSKEYVNIYGPGIGLNMNIYRILIGANYYMMQGGHNWVGNPTGELDYEMTMFTSFIGLHFSVSKSMDVLFSYSSSSGELPRNKTNFNADASLESNTFWIHLSYGSGETINKFFTRLFK